MRGWLGMAACLVALLWGGVVHADGDIVTLDSVQVGVEVEVEVAGEQIAAPAAELTRPAHIDVPALIIDAARRWGLDERVLLRIAWCESRYDPNARGAAGLAGVFQFAPITWSWVAEKAGYPGASPYDAYANIEAAAYLYKTEGPKHWGCK